MENVATIPLAILVEAYREGRFPMCHEDGDLYWHDPDPRAVFPLEAIGPNARLQRALRKSDFTLSIDRDFKAVIRACADRDETWIDERIIASYITLHHAGFAHSVEVTAHGELVGGIYGVALSGAFFGESMFSSESNASKAAFHFLVRHLRAKGFLLFDSQYINDFTEQLGAVEIPRSEFRSRLQKALAVRTQF